MQFVDSCCRAHIFTYIHSILKYESDVVYSDNICDSDAVMLVNIVLSLINHQIEG